MLKIRLTGLNQPPTLKRLSVVAGNVVLPSREVAPLRLFHLAIDAFDTDLIANGSHGLDQFNSRFILRANEFSHDVPAFSNGTRRHTASNEFHLLFQRIWEIQMSAFG